MQKKNLFKPLAAAAVGIFLGAACCSVSNEAGVCNNAVKYSMELETSEVNDMQPWQIYCCNNCDVFKLQDICNMQNQSEAMVATVNGETLQIPFWDWVFDGEKAYSFEYRFVWFDKDGKYVSASPVKTCETMPTDPVRFTAVYPDEKCASFSLLLERKDIPVPAAETPSCPQE